MKNFNILGVHWKTWLLGGGEGGVMKNQYRGEDCLKRGGAWTVCQFKGAWQERGGVFEGGGGDTPIHTMPLSVPFFIKTAKYIIKT